MFPSGWIWSHLPPPTALQGVSHLLKTHGVSPLCQSFFPTVFPMKSHEIQQNLIEIQLKSHWNPTQSHWNHMIPLSFLLSAFETAHVPGLFDQRLIDFGLQKAQLFRLAPGQISWVSRSPCSMGIWGISNISMMRIWVNHNNSPSHGKSPFDS
jgi:hypothetical protein